MIIAPKSVPRQDKFGMEVVLSDPFDILTDEQEDAVMAGLDFSMGMRLGALINHLGMDKSVQKAGKSAKQLKRYISGDEPPMGALQNLCRAAGASMDWLMEAEPRSKIDCQLEMFLLQEEKKRLEPLLDASVSEVDRVMIELALASISALLEIADQAAAKLPERSHSMVSQASLAKQRLQAKVKAEAGATHEGMPKGNSDVARSTGINFMIFRAVKKLVRQVNRAATIRLSDEAQDEEAVRWYNELVRMADGSTDEGKLRSRLGVIEYEMNEAVKQAAINPGSGKREAS